jgi:hypothetical protein
VGGDSPDYLVNHLLRDFFSVLRLKKRSIAFRSFGFDVIVDRFCRIRAKGNFGRHMVLGFSHDVAEGSPFFVVAIKLKLTELESPQGRIKEHAKHGVVSHRKLVAPGFGLHQLLGGRSGVHA